MKPQVSIARHIGAFRDRYTHLGCLSGRRRGRRRHLRRRAFKGTAPAPKKLRVTKDKRRCDKSPKFDESLVVKDGKLVNAVVYISDVKGGKKMEMKGVTFDQNGCQYQPHVLAGSGWRGSQRPQSGQGASQHPHLQQGQQAMNRAQPKFKKKLKVKFDKPEIMEVKCDVHGWMSGWIFVAGNPYYSVTGEDGAFSLTDLPAGKYKVEIWHEKLGTQTKEVEVKAGETAKLDIEFAG